MCMFAYTYIHMYISCNTHFQQKITIPYYDILTCFFQGLRITALVGIVGTCVGSWVKVFSVQPDLFYVTFIGQTIVALAQVCMNMTDNYKL